MMQWRLLAALHNLKSNNTYTQQLLKTETNHEIFQCQGVTTWWIDLDIILYAEWEVESKYIVLLYKMCIGVDGTGNRSF